jgi:hypothetical protein
MRDGRSCHDQSAPIRNTKVDAIYSLLLLPTGRYVAVATTVIVIVAANRRRPNDDSLDVVAVDVVGCENQTATTMTQQRPQPKE